MFSVALLIAFFALERFHDTQMHISLIYLFPKNDLSTQRELFIQQMYKGQFKKKVTGCPKRKFRFDWLNAWTQQTRFVNCVNERFSSFNQKKKEVPLMKRYESTTQACQISSFSKRDCMMEGAAR